MAKLYLGFSCALFLSLMCFNFLISHGAIESSCKFGVVQGNTLYNYSLTSRSDKFPHGILSEDGFYKVELNGTIIWFQLCDEMIFNHDQPACFDCQDCGGQLRCGMTCSALVSNNLGGYDVCTTIGASSSSQISLIDESNPKKGVLVKMVYSGSKNNCSLSVSVLCDSSLVKVPSSFSVSGACDYVTELIHPLGCAILITQKEKGYGWFGTLLIILLCLLGAYFLIGTIFRYFFLKIHSLEAIPNLEFWASLFQRGLGCLFSCTGQMRQNRATYSPVTNDNFSN